MNESVNFMCWHISHGTQVSVEWFEKNKYTLRNRYTCAHIHEDIYTDTHKYIQSYSHTYTCFHTDTQTHEPTHTYRHIDTQMHSSTQTHEP